MKRSDFQFLAVILALFLPFVFSKDLYDFYCLANADHGILLSFIKFAVLATLGESLGVRIRQGVYNYRGFGLLPRAIVWGLLGIAIKIAFIIFSQGAGAVLAYFDVMKNDSFAYKLGLAFTASAFMNIIFAPVMMMVHKITDTHIVQQGGTVKGLFSPIDVPVILKKVDWQMMWGFVFKKTIPFFWIPAHTITFLLPATFQVLFAAVLGIVLGVILAFAANKSK
ncbi:membrane protein [Alistipes sp. ZOR0009]|uniref:membrane protein n=1 Tax=Alistipes sp. ZOR0009 TaxID=1339253 RepID=UPI000648D336|nr:membrane protein [Alistipes sp. ZOR0009]